MAPTLGLLADQADLRLRFADGTGQVRFRDRSVARAWYTESEQLAHGHPAGTLVITSAARGWAEDPRATYRFFRRMRAASVAGVAFATGQRAPYSTVPGRVATFAELHGVPLLRLDYNAQWDLISRVIDEAREASAQRALQEYTGHLVQMRRVAVRDGARHLVGWLARVLDGWVVLTDATGRPIHSAAADADTGGVAAERVAAVAEEIRLAALGRRDSATVVLDGQTVLVRPVSRPGTRRCQRVLVVGRADGFGGHWCNLVNAVVDLLTVRLDADRAVQLREADSRLREVVLELLFAGSLGLASQVAARLTPGLPTGDLRLYAVHCSAADIEPVVSVCDHVAERTREPLWTAQGQDPTAPVTVLVPAGGRAERLLPPTLTALEGCYVGGSEITPISRVRDAYRQARDALLIARQLPSGWSVHDEAVPLPALLEQPAATEWAGRLLAGLTTHPDHEQLLATLRVWLDLHSRANRILGIHHKTLGQRLRRVETLLGMEPRSLAYHQQRLPLWLALRILGNDTVDVQPAPTAVDPGYPADCWQRLGELLDSPAVRRWASSMLEPLLSHSDQDRARTLRTWLDHSGHAPTTASLLGVHVNTVRNRLEQVENVLGRELTGPARYELHLALLVVDSGPGPLRLDPCAGPTHGEARWVS